MHAQMSSAVSAAETCPVDRPLTSGGLISSRPIAGPLRKFRQIATIAATLAATHSAKATHIGSTASGLIHTSMVGG